MVKKWYSIRFNWWLPTVEDKRMEILVKKLKGLAIEMSHSFCDSHGRDKQVNFMEINLRVWIYASYPSNYGILLLVLQSGQRMELDSFSAITSAVMELLFYRERDQAKIETRQIL